MIIAEGKTERRREDILSKSEGVDGILWTSHEPLNAEALDRAGPQLKAVSTSSAGNYLYIDDRIVMIFFFAI